MRDSQSQLLWLSGGLAIITLAASVFNAHDGAYGPYWQQLFGGAYATRGSPQVAAPPISQAQYSAPLPAAAPAQASPPPKFSLTVTRIPSDANLSLQGIASTYYDGIQLDPGKYTIVVTRDGYADYTGTFLLSGDTHATLSLCRLITEDVCITYRPKVESVTAAEDSRANDSRSEGCEELREYVLEQLEQECDMLDGTLKGRPDYGECSCERYDYLTGPDTYNCELDGSMECEVMEEVPSPCNVGGARVVSKKTKPDPACRASLTW